LTIFLPTIRLIYGLHLYYFLSSSHFHFLTFYFAGVLFRRGFYVSRLRCIIRSGCWHTATEFSGGAPPATWESLGYCTIVVVFECMGLTGYVMFALRHRLLLGACMFTTELCIASCRDGIATKFTRKEEMDHLDKSHPQIGKTVDTFTSTIVLTLPTPLDVLDRQSRQGLSAR
jgi:hypothetical protein